MAIMKEELIITVQGKTAFDYHSSTRHYVNHDFNKEELGEHMTSTKRNWANTSLPQ